MILKGKRFAVGPVFLTMAILACLFGAAPRCSSLLRGLRL